MRSANIPDQGRLATAAGRSRETVNNILLQKVDADEETIADIARACRVPIPTVEWRLTVASSPQEGRSAIAWIDDATAALGQAKRQLMEGSSESPATVARVAKLNRSRKKAPKRQTEDPDAEGEKPKGSQAG